MPARRRGLPRAVVAAYGLVVLLCLAGSLQAQEPGALETTAQEPESDVGSSESQGDTAAAATPTVTGVSRVEREDEKDPHVLSVEDRLEVDIQALAGWLDAADKSCRDIRLFLDERPIEELGPEDCDVEQGKVWFELFRIRRGEEPAWTNLLQKRENFTAFVDISVGFQGADERPIASETAAQNVELVLVKTGQAWAALLFFLGSLALFLYLMRRSNIVRDGGADPDPANPRTRRPYSLARVQTAIWFFLILWAYLFIAILVTSSVDIPTTCLGLMGISAATFLGAELIDSGKRAAGKALETPRPSRGLVNDLLSDSTGVAFHRFQMLAWTLVLGGVFAIRVWNELAMPDFDPTLLGLMGVSSGTYVGLKYPEEGKPAEAGGQANGSAAAPSAEAPSE